MKNYPLAKKESKFALFFRIFSNFCSAGKISGFFLGNGKYTAFGMSFFFFAVRHFYFIIARFNNSYEGYMASHYSKLALYAAQGNAENISAENVAVG